MERFATVPLLLIDFGIRKLPMTAAEGLLEIVVRRYERASTLLISNRPCRRLGRCGGGGSNARPNPGPRACAQVRPAELAHRRVSCGRLAAPRLPAAGSALRSGLHRLP
jgi:hypothetical protein